MSIKRQWLSLLNDFHFVQFGAQKKLEEFNFSSAISYGISKILRLIPNYVEIRYARIPLN